MKKQRVFIWITGLLLMISLMVWGGSVGAKTLEVKASDYPSISEKEMGHLRWIIKLADQLPGDWSHMGGREPGQEHMESHRYQLAFMTYFLALEQYHKTPAYREIYQRGMDEFIQKMLRKDVWGYWYEVSKGGKRYNPALKELGHAWIDPVCSKNIMYSGHLLHMVGLYNMLYRDVKYDEPGSITFTWDWVGFVRKKFEYDHKSLSEVIYKQFVENPWHSIECELNVIFPECNQHPILGLMLYDTVHSTSYSDRARKLFKKVFYDKGFIDPTTHRAMTFYMVQQKHVVPATSPAADGWTGAMMHAWDKEYIESHYPYQQKAGVTWQSDGTARAPCKVFGTLGDGYFAILAKEVGDNKTAEGILAWADKNMDPVWQDGMYHYPRNDDKHFTALCDNLLAVTRADVKDGLWALHSRPWGQDHFAKPYVSSVDYPKALVKQAFYDPDKDCLIVTLLPGTEDTRTTSFVVNNLDQSKVYSITKDGKTLGSLQKGVLHPDTGVKSLEWKADGTLKISTDLVRPCTFLVLADK